MNQYPIWIGLIVALVMVCIMPSPLWWMVAVIGMGANGVVVAANGWKMPVWRLKEESVRHCPMVSETRHKWLGDVIPVGFGKASIGDFFIAAGVMGVLANRDQIGYTKGLLLATLGIWAIGWSKGFSLFTKWPKEARRDAAKNIPIVMLMFLIGNLVHLHGCGVGELQAQAKVAIENLHTVKPPSITEIRKHTRSLGDLVAPSSEELRRMSREAKRWKEEQARQAVLQLVNQTGSSFFVMQPVGGRKGPFCRVTCAVHHNDKYDVEVEKQFCNANWIPPQTEYIAGWAVEPTGKYEYNSPWPGPATPGFHNYKLYWRAQP